MPFIMGHCDTDSLPICICSSMCFVISSCIFSIYSARRPRCPAMWVTMAAISPTFLSSVALFIAAT